MVSFLIFVGISPSYPTVVGWGQLVEWAASSKDLICYRSTYGEYVVELSTLDSPLCTSVLWHDWACPHQSRCRIYLKVRSVRVVREYPPGRPIWATAIYSEGNRPHRITTMGFYGTLKMIFYKVSRITESLLTVYDPFSSVIDIFEDVKMVVMVPADLRHRNICRFQWLCRNINAVDSTSLFVIHYTVVLFKRIIKILVNPRFVRDNFDLSK